MFYSARITLTTWYLLIIMSVSIFFSGVIYNVISREVNRFATKQQYSIVHELGKSSKLILLPPIDPDLVEETHQRVLILLGIINGIIFIASGFFGYMLAGKTLRPIQEMVDEQNRFISDASHELRTPLTSLKSAMEVSLRDKQFNLKDAKTLIVESIEEVNKLQSLAESLLQLAQYQLRSNHPPFQKFEAEQLIVTAVKKVTPSAKLKKIRIETKTIKQTVNGNQDALTDLLVILLDNAIKYSPAHSQITIKVTKKASSLYIDIRDQGIGMKPSEIEKIFDRFYRADNARSTSGTTNGYGLGLSIAKKLVDIHKGTISVKSTSGKGSTFTIKLPILQK